MHLIYFASNNKNKYREIKSWVTKSALNLKFAHLMLTEIQADLIDNIAIEKAKDAFLKLSKPVLCGGRWPFHKFVEWFSWSIPHPIYLKLLVTLAF